MKLLKLAPLALALVLTGATTASIAQVTVGGAPMVATKDIVDNAVNSKDHPRWWPRSRPPDWSTR
jgi:hypothetical protein